MFNQIQQLNCLNLIVRTLFKSTLEFQFYKVKRQILFLIATTLFFSCNPQNQGTKDNGLEEVKLDGKTSNADIVRMPISADKDLDTLNIAKIVFEEPIYNFGSVTEGSVVKHTFKFRNTGNKPLLISDIMTTCGCTVPTWNKSPIQPGGTDVVSVSFNTDGKINEQNKKITVISNTFPAQNDVVLRGAVMKNN